MKPLAIQINLRGATFMMPLSSAGRRRFTLTCMSLSCAAMRFPVYAAVSPQSQDRALKRVFAHYMVAWPRGGPHASVESYQSEFRDAQARGIDGFALNCGGWDKSEPQYKRRVLQMYDAASHLDFEFKLFVSADGKAQNEIDDIIATTRELPAQLWVDGRPVLSAYAAGRKNFAAGAPLVPDLTKLRQLF